MDDQKRTDQPKPSHPESLLDVDAAIVGAGLSGLTAAWLLHQAGLNVVVLGEDARELAPKPLQPGDEPSGSNGRAVRR